MLWSIFYYLQTDIDQFLLLSRHIAQLSLNLSFSLAELDFILDFFPTHPTTQPITHPGKFQNDQIQENIA